jgi:hypothetical protein
VRAIATAVAALLGASVVAPHVPMPPVIAFVLGFSAIVAGVLSTSVGCPRPPKVALLGVLVCAGVLAVLSEVGVALPPWLAAAVVTALLLAGATLLGASVGAGVEQAGHLWVVAVVSSLADAASVLSPSGPSAMIAESEVALSVLALPWPMLGTDAIEPMLGAGDVVFAALYFAAARKHGLPPWRTWVALASGFALALACVVGLEQAVPALPFLGLAIVVAHPQARALAWLRERARKHGQRTA